MAALRLQFQFSGNLLQSSSKRCSLSSKRSVCRLGAVELEDCALKVAQFDGGKPVEESLTAPSSWYWSSSLASLEMECIFGRGWHAAGYVEQLENPRQFFTGSLGRVRYVVCRDEQGQLHAFHNVCRHHAAPVASGSGCTPSFSCPYHGWTYGLDGNLLKATRITGIKNFNPRESGLVPIQVAAWGPFVLINLDAQANQELVAVEWLGSSSDLLVAAGIDRSLRHVARRDYVIDCNWKVYCDNYLDGGYHVPFAHPGLAKGLDLASYKTVLYETVSIQSCRSKNTGEERLGERATYAFVYPNFMINRYGPWMDTNLVLPIAPNKCQVVFDYYLEPQFCQDKEFIASSLEESDQVQREDVTLCQSVQQGLESLSYDAGRYAPKVEEAMHHFHCRLHNDLLLGIKRAKIPSVERSCQREV
ncbi:choline monooxygenase, chloroplastic isoform X1 [Selaginella moellendorffii]|uniref:choline monooxygenase, chloroplastic isoform X1 n=1 Tax=Selaginella moellendorffii TaxID=88036 RepID=UPI000D1CAE7C|nr:choline monooxygenase, chloroplastic isoform X1 [Selaginella moellendorffii]|eukprot:XP_002981049.2 choline monooxygenase, chloroplastic isoform X1 [Selaginella moellendorffii]